MIRFELTSGGEDQVLERLTLIESRLLNLHGIAARIGDIIATDNMAARMAGLDKDNEPFTPLAESTLQDRVGGGPPLAPMEMASRIISDFTIDLVDFGPNAIDIIGSWPNMPFLQYHVEGTARLPSRDPVGIRPQGWALIGDALDEWVDDLDLAAGAWG